MLREKFQLEGTLQKCIFQMKKKCIFGTFCTTYFLEAKNVAEVTRKMTALSGLQKYENSVWDLEDVFHPGQSPMFDDDCLKAPLKAGA